MLKITLSLAVSVASLVAPAAVIVDSSKVPEYSKWAKEELQPEMEKYLPKIVKLIDGEGATVPDVDYTIFLTTLLLWLSERANSRMRTPASQTSLRYPLTMTAG